MYTEFALIRLTWLVIITGTCLKHNNMFNNAE